LPNYTLLPRVAPIQPCNLQGLILLRKYPAVTILPMPAYRWGVKIFLSVVERIFPSGPCPVASCRLSDAEK